MRWHVRIGPWTGTIGESHPKATSFEKLLDEAEKQGIRLANDNPPASFTGSNRGFREVTQHWIALLLASARPTIRFDWDKVIFPYATYAKTGWSGQRGGSVDPDTEHHRLFLETSMDQELSDSRNVHNEMRFPRVLDSVPNSSHAPWRASPAE